MLEEAQQIVKTVGDVTAVSVVVATLMSWLPAIAALFTVVWTGIRIYETHTVQHLIHKYFYKSKGCCKNKKK